MFIYTVQEHGPDGIKTQTFEGFRRYTGGTVPSLAIVSVTGELDLWVLSGDIYKAVEELQRYYRMMYQIEAAPVHVWQSL